MTTNSHTHINHVNTTNSTQHIQLHTCTFNFSANNTPHIVSQKINNNNILPNKNKAILYVLIYHTREL